jgi:HTH-type transcriptional regulator, sugar sensing transcriptional regulator
MNEDEVNGLFEYMSFTKAETAVYLALLELGSTTTGPIIKKADIPQGKVYVLLDKLLTKGIITYTLISGTKHFQAKNPTTLIPWFELMEKNMLEKKNKLMQLMPELVGKYTSSKYEKQVEIYEGFNGMKSLYMQILDKTDAMLIIGGTSSIPSLLEDFFMSWHKERINKKIHIKFIYNKERKKFAQNRESMKFTEVRYLDLPVSPSWTTIFEDYVIIVTVIDIKNITCFLIKDKGVSNTQRDYFNALWKQAK